MAVLFFGQFLVEQHYITAAQLQKVLSADEPRRLVALAARKGMLPAGVGERLASAYGPDLHGLEEHAVRDGLLTAQQLDYLQRLQKSDVGRICASLQRKGILSVAEVDEALAAFRQAQARYAIDFEHIPAYAQQREDITALIGLTAALFMETAGLPARLAPAVTYAGAASTQPLAVVIGYGGDATGRYVLCTSIELGERVARNMLGTEGPIGIDSVADAVGELGNAVVGSAASVLASMGREIGFTPPQRVGPLTPPVTDGIRCAISTLFGAGDLLLG